MKYSVRTIETASLLIAVFLGIIFHFIYNWSGENPVAGIFFPVNESTWEHLKLIFFPILLLTIVEFFFLNGKYKNIICVKFLSSLIGMSLTVVLFYTYQGIYGKNSEAMNILIYLISMAAAWLFSYQSLKKKRFCGISHSVCRVGFIVLTLLFILFTLFPPHIGLFASPV